MELRIGLQCHHGTVPSQPTQNPPSISAEVAPHVKEHGSRLQNPVQQGPLLRVPPGGHEQQTALGDVAAREEP